MLSSSPPTSSIIESWGCRSCTLPEQMKFDWENIWGFGTWVVYYYAAWFKLPLSELSNEFDIEGCACYIWVGCELGLFSGIPVSCWTSSIFGVVGASPFIFVSWSWRPKTTFSSLVIWSLCLEIKFRTSFWKVLKSGWPEDSKGWLAFVFGCCSTGV